MISKGKNSSADQQLSEYELLREQRIRDNKAKMADLGLDEKLTSPKKTPPSKTSKSSSKQETPSRHSARTANKPAPNYAEERIVEDEPRGRGRKRGAAGGEAYEDEGSSSEEGSDDDAPAPAVASSSEKAKPWLMRPLPKYDPKEAQAIFPGFEVARSGVSRDSDTGALKFEPAPNADKETASLVASLRPNRTPEEVLREGAFGGTYFRTIESGVAKETFVDQWKKDLPEEWREGLNPKTYLCRSWKSYDVNVNKFGVKSGQTLEDWESSGWITSYDPFGWFQW